MKTIDDLIQILNDIKSTYGSDILVYTMIPGYSDTLQNLDFDDTFKLIKIKFEDINNKNEFISKVHIKDIDEICDEDFKLGLVIYTND